MLDAASIIREAETAVGLRDPEPAVACNLEHLVAALNRQAGLSAVGIERTHRNLVSDSVNRLMGLRWLRDHPQIANEPIDAPVFLLGLPRSGTTYFQYIFDRDTRFRLIRTWESLTPSPPPGADPASAAERRMQWAQRRRREHPQFKGFEAFVKALK